MKNKIGKYVLLSVVGFVLGASGTILAKVCRDAQGIMTVLPYLMIGIGAGIFGQNIGTLVTNLAYRKNPEAAKQILIDTNDERNVSIRNQAKGKAYDIMIYVFGILMLVYALMQVELWVTLALVGAYLIVIMANVFYISRYNKNM